MKSMGWGILVVGLLATLLVTGSCGSAVDITLGAADDGRRVELSRGQGLEIALESNPTTGYRWEVAGLEGGVLRQVGEAEFQAVDSGTTLLVGAGGTETLRFQAERAGTTTLTLVYHRPWERGVEPLEAFEIQVVVR